LELHYEIQGSVTAPPPFPIDAYIRLKAAYLKTSALAL
jgi:hypothetical protein